MMQVQVWQICLFDCLISQGYKSDPIVTFIRKEIAFTKVLFAQLQNVQNLYKGVLTVLGLTECEVKDDGMVA